MAQAALGNKIVDAAFAIRVTRIPVLHGGIFDVSVIKSDKLNHRRMKLIGVKHRSRAAFEIANLTAFFSNDQRPFKLARIAIIDAEVSRQLHRALHAFGNVDKRPITKHSRI